MAVLKPSPNKLFILILIASTGCYSGPPQTNEQRFLESHNLDVASRHDSGVCTSAACEGEDCTMAGCHNAASTDIIAFAIAGTVFDSQDLNNAYVNSTASIEFYTGQGGSGELIKSLGVDDYGNFYSTEPITSFAYPTLRYQDTLGIVRYAHMPKPTAPTIPSNCNFCHQLAMPLSETPVLGNPQYLRINPTITSDARTDTGYHQSFTADPGPNCMDSACHGTGGTATQFTVAGVVKRTDTGDPYDLNDASIGLFVQECDDQRYNCQSSAAPEDVVPQIFNPKLLIEVNNRGHFYTTQPIDWTVPTYASLANYDNNTLCRNIKHMISAVPGTGDCYSCHDDATEPTLTINSALTESEKCAL